MISGCMTRAELSLGVPFFFGSSFGLVLSPHKLVPIGCMGHACHGFRTMNIIGLCLDEVKRGEKVISVTVVHCSTFRLFVVNIILP